MVEVKTPQLAGQQRVKGVPREPAAERAVIATPPHACTRGCKDEAPERLLLQNPLQERKQPGSMLNLVNDDASGPGRIREQFAEPVRVGQKVAAECRGLHIQIDGIRQLVANPG